MRKEKFIWLILVIVGLISLMLLMAYVIRFGSNGLSDNQSDWGDFGSYIGGVLGPIVSAAAFFVLIHNIRRENELFYETRFDANYFKLIDCFDQAKLYLIITPSIYMHTEGSMVEEKKNDRKGEGVFEYLNSRLQEPFYLNNKDERRKFRFYFNLYNEVIERYLQSIISVLRFYEKSIYQKDLVYIDFFKMHISHHEIMFLFHVSLGCKKHEIVQYINKYSLLENAPKQIFQRGYQLLPEYNKAAFGQTANKYNDLFDGAINDGTKSYYDIILEQDDM